MDDNQVISLLIDIKTQIAVLNTKVSELEKRDDQTLENKKDWQSIVFASLLSMVISVITPFILTRLYLQSPATATPTTADDMSVGKTISFKGS